MPLDVFLALASFAFASALTPGPNNIMVTASGVNFGFLRTLPHMCGIVIGFLALFAACAFGLGVLFQAYPPLQIAMKAAGAAYMLWLAWKIATAQPKLPSEQAQSRPLTFLQAAAFQWVNPKAVVTVMSAVAIYVRPTHWALDFTILFSVLAVATVAAVIVWTAFGLVLRRVFADPRHARMFNIAMALLLVASIVPMVI